MTLGILTFPRMTQVLKDICANGLEAYVNNIAYHISNRIIESSDANERRVIITKL